MAGLDVNARLTADASGFIGPMNKAAEVVTATGRATAKAARDAAQGQAFAAKYAGDAVSDQSKRIVAAMLAEKQASQEYRTALGFQTRGNLDDVTAANALTASYQKLTAAKLQTAAASKVAEHGFGDRVAASSVVRGLETGNVGIRAVEASLTKLVGSNVLQAAFSIIGPVAFAAAVAKGAYELYEFEQKAAGAGKAAALAFRDADDSARVATDDLELRASKLQDQIDKLMGHRNNGMATALLEAAKMADELLPKLQADRKELEALLKEHDVSGLGELLSGVASTGKQTDEMLADSRKLIDGVDAITDEFDAYTSKLKDPKALKGATEERNRRVHTLFQSQIDAYHNEAGRLRKEQADSERESAAAANAGEGSTAVSAIDNSAKIADAAGRERQLRRLQRNSDATALIGDREATVGSLKSDKESKTDDNKANELRLKAMEAHVAEWKTLTEVTVTAQENYWQSVQDSFARGSAQYDTILNKRAALSEEAVRKLSEGLKRVREEEKRGGEEKARIDLQLLTAGDPMRKDLYRATAERTDASNEAAAQAARNAGRLEEIRIQEAAGSTMTRIAGATAMAAAHTREYGVELERLLQRRAAIAADPYSTAEERERQNGSNEKAIARVRADRNVQVLQDQYSINMPNSSAMVGAKDAIEAFTRSATNSAQIMGDITTRVLEGVNRNLVEELTTHRRGPQHLWTNLGKSVATDVTGGALKAGEGMLLKSLLGNKAKPDGTQANPMWVRMAGEIGGLASKAAGAVSGGASGAVSGFAGFLGKLAPVFGLPGFADGVNNFSGGMAIVGERGPEILSLPRGSSVTPNHAIDRGFSSGMTFAPMIDARNASDPAQVRAQVNQGLAEALPHFKAAAAAHIADQKRRTIGK